LASSYELLEDVNWQKIFSSFYEIVWIKIKCRDVSKIPKERLFCIDKRLYKITTMVEMTAKDKLERGYGGDTKMDDRRDDEEKDNFDGLMIWMMWKNKVDANRVMGERKMVEGKLALERGEIYW
jgi:hypothetical protein